MAARWLNAVRTLLNGQGASGASDVTEDCDTRPLVVESNRGRRLDHIWISPTLKGGLKSQTIVTKMRGWQKASDHVPVVAEIEV